MERMKFYTLWISAVIVFVFILQILINGFTDAFVLSDQSWIRPWRFLTAIFLHGSLAHIVFNLFALILFGLILENLIGSKKFLVVFFASGILANLIAVNFYSSSLGASGAIFGIIGALILVRPMLTVWTFGMPMPIFVAGIIWAGADILGAYGFFTGNPIDNTGNIAHLFGLAFGLLLGALFRRGVTNNFGRKEAQSGRVHIDESYMRGWEERYLGR